MRLTPSAARLSRPNSGPPVHRDLRRRAPW